MDETTQSESSTVVSSPGHLEHVRIRESLVLKLLLLQFIGVAMNSEKRLLLNIYVCICSFLFLVLLAYCNAYAIDPSCCPLVCLSSQHDLFQ